MGRGCVQDRMRGEGCRTSWLGKEGGCRSWPGPSTMQTRVRELLAGSPALLVDNSRRCRRVGGERRVESPGGVLLQATSCRRWIGTKVLRTCRAQHHVQSRLL